MEAAPISEAIDEVERYIRDYVHVAPCASSVCSISAENADVHRPFVFSQAYVEVVFQGAKCGHTLCYGRSGFYDDFDDEGHAILTRKNKARAWSVFPESLDVVDYLIKREIQERIGVSGYGLNVSPLLQQRIDTARIETCRAADVRLDQDLREYFARAGVGECVLIDVSMGTPPDFSLSVNA